MGRAAFALILCTLGGLLFAGFRHYGQSYAPRLRPGEGWLHMQPRFYEERFAETAGTFRDHVYLSWMTGAEVSVLTQNDALFTNRTPKSFRDGFRRDMDEKLPGTKFADCKGHRTEETAWMCLEMYANKDGVTTRQRLYFTHRGSSNILVAFTASPPERFSYFGDPRSWLANLEWSGPSLAYAF